MEIYEDIGWNDCLKFLIKDIERFCDSLSGGKYDYFPEDEIKEYFKSLMK